MNKQYIVKVKDEEGIVWVYEGDVRGNPIFTFEHVAKPKLVSLTEAHDIELKHKMANEQYIIERT
jgi:hypothetical protein